MPYTMCDGVIQKIIKGDVFRRISVEDLPVQVSPFPVHPAGQAHVKLPGVLLQTATAWQPPLFDAHSSISTPTDDT